MKAMSIHKGYTLIEVLIVIGIFAATVLTVAPLTGAWLREAQMVETEGELTQAIGRAKAIALRNEMAAIGNNPAAAICINRPAAPALPTITVREGANGVSPSCEAVPAGVQAWQTPLRREVAITANNIDVNCICFDNRGLLTTAGGCGACSVNTVFTLAAGGGSEPLTVSLF